MGIQTINASLTTGAAVVTLPAAVRSLRIHNPTTGNKLAYTLDGSTPAVNGQGFTVAAGGTDVWDLLAGSTPITGPLTMIGAASQVATVAFAA